jgi:hypothetical protein
MKTKQSKKESLEERVVYATDCTEYEDDWGPSPDGIILYASREIGEKEIQKNNKAVEKASQSRRLSSCETYSALYEVRVDEKTYRLLKKQGRIYADKWEYSMTQTMTKPVKVSLNKRYYSNYEKWYRKK